MSHTFCCRYSVERKFVRFRLVLCLAAALVLVGTGCGKGRPVLPGPQSGSPWPMFGADSARTGRSRHVGPRRPVIKWVYEDGDLHCWDPPAISADGTIYLVCGLDLYAIGPDGTGGALYEPEASAFLNHGTPSIGAEGELYLGLSDGFVAVNPDGTTRWTWPFSSYATSTAIGRDGTVFLVYDDVYQGEVCALDRDGTFKWRVEEPVIYNVSPAVGPDGTVYVCTETGLLAVGQEGDVRWSAALESEPCDSTPAVDDDGTVYVKTYYDNLFAIGPGGVVKWSYTYTSESFSLPSSDHPSIGWDGTVYFNTGIGELVAVWPDGKLRWIFRPLQSFYSYSSPAAIDARGTLYFQAGDLYAVDPDGTEIWTVFTGGYSTTTPAIGSDGTIYAVTSDSVYAVGEQEGNLL